MGHTATICEKKPRFAVLSLKRVGEVGKFLYVETYDSIEDAEKQIKQEAEVIAWAGATNWSASEPLLIALVDHKMNIFQILYGEDVEPIKDRINQHLVDCFQSKITNLNMTMMFN